MSGTKPLPGQRSPLTTCRSPLGDARSPNRSPVTGPRVTMSGFGSLLPRPSGQQSPRIISRDPTVASPGQPPGQSPMLACRQSPRTTTRSGTDVKKALGTRGGVVRNQDGFEVFYGVGNKQAAPKMSKAKDPQRDGFDVFYGIQNKDRMEEQQLPRQSPVQRSRTLNAGKEATQLEVQLNSRLGATNSGSKFMPVGRSVSDSYAYQYMQDLVPADRRPDISILCSDEVSEAIRDGQEQEQEQVLLGGSPQIVHRETQALVTEKQSNPMQPHPPLPPSSSVRIPKSLEVFSMSGRPQQQALIPTGVTSFSVATPTASFVPAPCSTGASGSVPLQQPPPAASEAPALAKRLN